MQASVYLASQNSDAFVPVHEMSRALGISASFLAKIVRELTRSGLLESYRGPNGGVALSQSADTICVRDIIVAIDGPDLFECCLLGLPGCGTEAPCPLHEEWSKMRDQIETSFAEMDLATLAAQADNHGRLISLDGDSKNLSDVILSAANRTDPKS